MSRSKDFLSPVMSKWMTLLLQSRWTIKMIRYKGEMRFFVCDEDDLMKERVYANSVYAAEERGYLRQTTIDHAELSEKGKSAILSKPN